MPKFLTVRRYAALVTLAGLVVLSATVATVPMSPVADHPITFLLLAMLLGASELFPVQVVGTDRAGLVTVSIPFLLSLLLSFDVAAAGLTLVGASLAADLLRHRPIERAGFNAGQYALSLAAADVALRWLTRTIGDSVFDQLSIGDCLTILLAGACFVAVNHVLTMLALTLDGVSDVRGAVRGFGVEAVMGGVLLLSTPVTFLVAEHRPALLPMLLLPAVAVHRSARMSAQKEQEALHDPLTGLPNRNLLQTRLEQALQAADANGHRVSVMLVDLDGFKEVNDTLGHSTGDLLLRDVAVRLREGATPGATVARLGGDEFALVLPNLSCPDQADEAGGILQGILREPFLIEGFSMDVDASIGIAVYPEHGDDPETLLRCADVAMYVAKDQRVGIQRYSPERDTHSRRRLALLGELRGAIESGQFTNFYQPKIALSDGRITGVEALVRWQHPVHGLLPPGEFIPLAERTIHIDTLTRYVINGALRQSCAWREAGLEMPVAVNVPPHTLHDTDFPQWVERLLAHWDVPPSWLQLEITEGTIIRDVRRAVSALGVLHRMGVRLAIDDFGTGYSSLAYLKQLPVDTVKIDRSFVSQLARDSDNRAIVRATVQLTRSLGMETVAEGVEDATTLAVLRELGCDHAQGYLLTRPEPPSRLTPWLRAYHPIITPVTDGHGAAETPDNMHGTTVREASR